MADRGVARRKKKEEKAAMTPQAPISKQEKAVAHWLKRNLPTKKTKFLHSHEVKIDTFKTRWMNPFSSENNFFFPFLAIKLGRFIEKAIFLLCYKEGSLAAKIGNPSRAKFGGLDS
jgi:hypothetical protein